MLVNCKKIMFNIYMNLSRRLFNAGIGAGVVGIKLPRAGFSQSKKLKLFTPIYSGDRANFQHFIDSYKTDIEFFQFDNFYEASEKIMNGVYVGDLFVSAYQFASRLMVANKLTKLDTKRIVNYEKPTLTMVGEFDEKEKDYIISAGRTFSVLSYDKKFFSTPPDSWGALFDKAPPNAVVGWNNEDNGALVQLASLYLGYGYNTNNKNHLKIVRDFLINVKKQRKPIISNDHVYLFNQVKANIVNSITPSFFQLKNNNYAPVFPKEGIFQGEGVLSVPANCQNLDAVYNFLSYIHIPQVAKSIAESTFVAANRESVRKLTKIEFQTNKFIYPDFNAVKIENILFNGENNIRNLNAIWQEVLKA